jgi:hypothetical protein
MKGTQNIAVDTVSRLHAGLPRDHSSTPARSTQAGAHITCSVATGFFSCYVFYVPCMLTCQQHRFSNLHTQFFNSISMCFA